MAESSDVIPGANAAATDLNKLRADVILAKAIDATETDAATVTVNWADKTKGKIRDVTIDDDRNIVFSGAVVKQSLLLNIIQGSGGSKVPTWDGSMTIKWPSGVAPTLSTTEGAIDSFLFICEAADTYRAYFAGFDLR